MLKDQKGSTLSDKEKIKGWWKQYTESLYRRDKRITETFEEDSYKEEPVILESEVKTAVKLLGGSKSPGVDRIVIELFLATKTESVKILTRICQQI